MITSQTRRTRGTMIATDMRAGRNLRNQSPAAWTIRHGRVVARRVVTVVIEPFDRGIGVGRRIIGVIDRRRYKNRHPNNDGGPTPVMIITPSAVRAVHLVHGFHARCCRRVVVRYRGGGQQRQRRDERECDLVHL